MRAGVPPGWRTALGTTRLVHHPTGRVRRVGRAFAPYNPRQRDIRYDRGGRDGVGASAGRESCCFSLPEGLTRSVRWLPASPGCTARGWGATGGGLGVLRVGGAFVQYAQPLASRSRPSWSRPTRGRSRVEPARCGQNRRRTMPSGPHAGGRGRGWTCGGGSGLCHQEPRTRSCAARCPQC